MHLLQHSLGFLVAAWFAWLPGWWLGRRFALTDPSDSGTPPMLVHFTAGLALWVAGLFALATLGLYRPAPILGLAGLWHLLAFVEARRGGIQIRSLVAGWGSLRPSGSSLLFGATALVVLGPVFALALTPTVSWDSSTYHLTLPKLYLEAGGFHLVEMNVYSHWPQGLELLFGAAMALQTHILAKLLHFGCGLLVLAALVRVVPGRSGWLAAALFLLNDVVLFEMRVAYVDLAYAFALLAGVVFAANTALDSEVRSEPNRHHDPKNLRGFLLTGMAAGLLISIKVTGLVSAFVLALLLVPKWLRGLREHGAKAALRPALAFAVPCCALGAPWWVKTWILTGNPVYPWMWSLFGGPDWSASLGEQFARWQQGIGMGRAWDDYLLLPWRVIVNGGQGYSRFDGELGLFWLLALPLALWGLRASVDGHARWRFFVAAAALHMLFWAASSQQTRFLIPVLPLLAAPAAAVLRSWFAGLSFSNPPRRRLLVGVATGLFLASALTSHPQVLSGGVRLLPVFLHPSTAPRAPVPKLFEDVERLPRDARLLMLNTNQGFYCPRPYLADSFFEASQINDWLRAATTPGEVLTLLKERSITHILYLHSEGGGLPYPQPLFDLLNDPATAERVGFDGQYLLFALRK